MNAKPGHNRGVKNYKAKLTESDVIAIFMNEDTHRDRLAWRYHVSVSAIGHIKSRSTWGWLTKDLKRAKENVRRAD